MATSLGRLYVDLLMKTGSFETDAGRAARVAEKRAREIEKAFDRSMGKVTGGLAKAGAAVVGFVAAYGIAEKSIRGFFDAVNNADKLDELSNRLGVSVEQLSTLSFVAERTGGDLDMLATALPKLSKQIVAAGDESSKAAGLFKALGVEIKDAEGNLRSADDVLLQVADGFKELQNDTLEQALAMELFGKSGAELLEFLNLGSDGIETMQGRARELGGELSGNTATAAAKFNDLLQDLRTLLQGSGRDILEQVLPPLNSFVGTLVKSYQEGGLAAEAVDTLAGALGRLAIMFDFAVQSADGWREVQRNIGLRGLFDEGSVFGGLEKVEQALARGQTQLDDLIARQEAAAVARASGRTTAPVVSEGIDFSRGAPLTPEQRRQKERNVGAWLAGTADTDKPKRTGGGRSRAPEISDAAREAERLQELFASLSARSDEDIARMQEQLRIGGEVGEAWRVAYEIQNGELAKLLPQQQQDLLAKAQQRDALREQIDLSEELREKDKRADDYIAALEEEALRLGMSNEQLALRNALQEADVELTSERGQKIAQLVEYISSETAAMERVTAVMDEFRTGFSDAITDFVTGSKSAKDAFRDFFDDLHKRIIQMIADQWMEQLFGQMGTTGAGSTGGGWLSNLFGGLFGNGTGGGTAAGSSGGSIWGNIIGQAAGSGGAASGGGGFWSTLFGSIFGGGRAYGGPVSGGRMYEVNERGMPEMLHVRNKQMLLMPPNVNGMVRPMSGGGGSVGQTNNFYLSAPTDPRTQQQIADKTGFTAQRAMNRNR